MKIKKCENNHFYDGDKHDTCPHCNKKLTSLTSKLFTYKQRKYQSTSDSINIVEIETKKLEVVSFSDNNPYMETINHGSKDFAFKLSSKLSKKIENKNFIFSPLFVWMQLAALLNASKEQFLLNLTHLV